MIRNRPKLSIGFLAALFAALLAAAPGGVAFAGTAGDPDDEEQGMQGPGDPSPEDDGDESRDG